MKKIFTCLPITAFRRNKNLKELIESNKTEKKSQKDQMRKLKPGKCSPNLANLRSLYGKQVQKIITFKESTNQKNI